jgi:hypothetical protein
VKEKFCGRFGRLLEVIFRKGGQNLKVPVRSTTDSQLRHGRKVLHANLLLSL